MSGAARKTVLGVGVALLGGALTAGALEVSALERRELEHDGPAASLAARAGQVGATGVSARIAQLELTAGEHVSFELCAQADLAAAGAAGAFELIVWRPPAPQLALRVPLDAAHLARARPVRGGNCLPLGGGRIADSGRYALDAVWPQRPLSAALGAIPLWGRVVAQRPLGMRAAALVLACALGSLLCALAGFAQTTHAAWAPSARRSALWALGFSLLGSLSFAGALRLPLPGARGGLVRGLLVAGLELGLAVAGAWLLFRSARRGLCLFAPRTQPGAWLLLACLAALALHPLAWLAQELAPRGARAPIEAFIAWPSGALSFALLGMAVPLAEELFFRGLLYGALSPLGKPLAMLGSVGLFAAAHAQQAWGNWGVLISLTLTGAVLTGLRALSGSTLVPAVAHVLYNLSLWRDSFRG